MKPDQVVQKLTEILRRKHFALNTEQSYCAWLKRYCNYIRALPSDLPSEQKLERFLTALAKDDVAVSTQNQAFNAIIFCNNSRQDIACCFIFRSSSRLEG